MPKVTLWAHYDGERIQLDEPFDLRPGVPLLVTVRVPDAPETEADRSTWAATAGLALPRAYGSDEPEYTLADVK